MTPAETALLILSALLQAPVAFRLGFVVRDGREYATGFRFLMIGAGIAALVCFVSHSVIIAVLAAGACTVMLAHARFMSACTAPCLPGRTDAPVPAAYPETTPSASPSQKALADTIRSGMALLTDVMTTADRIGELRHRRRMRNAEYVRTVQPPPVADPEEGKRKMRSPRARPANYIRINPDPPPKKLPPPSP